jgi:release factor glutamine methyltransferase
MKRKQLERESEWLLKEKYQGKLTKAAQKDIDRLKAGEPIDYLIGFVEFAGCYIDLSKKPLIPRPETEHWVLKAIEDIKHQIQSTKDNIQALDMFAGSGCVGVAVLKHVQKANVDFAEKEKTLLLQILLNLKKNDITKERFVVICSNVFSGILKKYDYIFANPPYVAEKRKQSVQSSVLQHEPKEALFAGKDGLKYIKSFLKEAQNHLLLGGKIYLEFDSSQRKDIEVLLERYDYASWQFHKDQYGRWRFVVAGN